MAPSIFPAERYTIDSTARIWMAIFASFSFIIPKSPICLPNALRSLVYFDAVASTCFAPPTHEAPSVKRPAFKMLNATMWPRPISCSTFSFGTLQFSRKIGVVELPWMPILCSSLPALNPGKVRSTMNAVNFSPLTFANTMYTSANPPLVIHIFCPFRMRSVEHTSELQSRLHLVCCLLLEKKTRKSAPIHCTLPRPHYHESPHR